MVAPIRNRPSQPRPERVTPADRRRVRRAVLAITPEELDLAADELHAEMVEESKPKIKKLKK